MEVVLRFWQATETQGELLSIALRFLVENSYDSDTNSFVLGFTIERNMLYLVGEVDGFEFDGEYLHSLLNSPKLSSQSLHFFTH